MEEANLNAYCVANHPSPTPHPLENHHDSHTHHQYHFMPPIPRVTGAGPDTDGGRGRTRRRRKERRTGKRKGWRAKEEEEEGDPLRYDTNCTGGEEGKFCTQLYCCNIRDS